MKPESCVRAPVVLLTEERPRDPNAGKPPKKDVVIFPKPSATNSRLGDTLQS